MLWNLRNMTIELKKGVKIMNTKKMDKQSSERFGHLTENMTKKGGVNKGPLPQRPETRPKAQTPTKKHGTNG